MLAALSCMMLTRILVIAERIRLSFESSFCCSWHRLNQQGQSHKYPARAIGPVPWFDKVSSISGNARLMRHNCQIYHARPVGCHFMSLKQALALGECYQDHVNRISQMSAAAAFEEAIVSYPRPCGYRRSVRLRLTSLTGIIPEVTFPRCFQWEHLSLHVICDSD
jgi:hypothetical protein